MSLTISQKADALGTYRFVCARLMETLAAWVPTSPELEVKTLFGRHLWHLAQAADQIGHRTVELRAKLHYERRPLEPYLAALRQLGDAPGSGNRIAGLYDVCLPDLVARLTAYVAATDALLDAPTVDILQRILGDVARMEHERLAVVAVRPDVAAYDVAERDRLKLAFASCAEVVDYRDAVIA